ncbi:MAG TPA: sigma-70 family RNA polymerase sigma factor [Solirubrobacterales bacterium]|jgi:RNA polymerase primary sigma factor|nr:sigma-70 family RNA polymerase sigma factor [Solirubrobacterales bacterium]
MENRPGPEKGIDDNRLDDVLVEAARADLEDDVIRTGVLCDEDDVNRTADRHQLSVIELAELRRRARSEGLLTLGDENPAPERALAGTEGDNSVSGLSVLFSRLREYPLLDAAGEVALSRKIEHGALAEAQLRKEPTPVVRLELETTAEAGREAKKRLVGSNVRLAIANAKDFRGQGLDFDDLVQAAVPGLIRAAEKFDHRKGFKFSTYATWWIRQSISRAIANTGRTIRLPVHVIERLKKFQRVNASLEAHLGREPKSEELAAALDWDPAEVTGLIESVPTIVSLETPVGTEGTTMTLGDLLISERPTPDDEAEDLLRLDMLQAMLGELDPRSREVLDLRYGLSGPPKTLEEVGEKFNVTRERVRQIERDTLAKLRQEGLARGFPS